MDENKNQNPDAPLMAKTQDFKLPEPEKTDGAVGPAAAESGLMISSLPRDAASAQTLPLQESSPDVLPSVEEVARGLREASGGTDMPQEYVRSLREAMSDGNADISANSNAEISNLRKALRIVLDEAPQRKTVAQELGVTPEKVSDVFSAGHEMPTIKTAGGFYVLGADLNLSDDTAVKKRLNDFAQAEQMFTSFYS